ncbi:MAG: hypothetical protein EA358_00545 [Flavobacteriales bacterium]|nr:MAG: hypothetical protein EA358_00545 [Flavobacteriales bacterium]
MKKIIYLLTSALLLSLSSCKKKEDKERPEFDYQPQHFSCYVNGEEFVPRVQGMCGGTKTFYDPDGFLNTNPGYLTFSGSKCLADDVIDVGFTLNPILEVGNYQLQDTTMEICFGFYSNVNEIKYSYNGHINITKLEPQTYRPFVQGRIEGTFEMSCANDQGDTVHITDGSFSLNLR